MPRTKRPPIDYTPQFGAGVFRPKEAVDEDLAALGQPEPEPPPPPATSPTERSNEQTNVRTNHRAKERTRVRHSFDVWQDQLLALTEIQARAFSATGRKPKLGELVQDALDAYIAQQKKRSNVRTNERTGK